MEAKFIVATFSDAEGAGSPASHLAVAHRADTLADAQAWINEDAEKSVDFVGEYVVYERARTYRVRRTVAIHEVVSG